MKKRKKRGLLLVVIIICIGLLLYIKHVQELKNTPLPTSLHPIVEEKTDKLVEQAKNIGINILITHDFRTVEEQDKLYDRGRTAEGNIVTYAKGGTSYHNYGLAIDFAIKLEDGSVIWDMEYDGNQNGQSDWLEVVAIAKELGFEWGGDWKNFKDYPHLQMDFGLSIRELQMGKRPDGWK
ncbi:peptidoglycan L-alanyl-D-glutamate endopeptidase CwlK [Salirhabdus euzebyi]|uniref:Peptidoglycan L-alanyl-D-glutamate endopeptidase CwlK n=1 Tax=Salirhabdus euzebyi TaxID=394506 RepID=A0A841Q6T2_9BACI|nr:M15 family metallopeptidase [Salirhabdus euzebyi]MBB6454063.1 peptidoglycan L-alanyl-D-glutamate endopeptidase CwlK [Salirhabdus euzebyi]